jgi:hypothetical protein
MGIRNSTQPAHARILQHPISLWYIIMDVITDGFAVDVASVAQGAPKP